MEGEEDGRLERRQIGLMVCGTSFRDSLIRCKIWDDIVKQKLFWDGSLGKRIWDRFPPERHSGGYMGVSYIPVAAAESILSPCPVVAFR